MVGVLIGVAIFFGLILAVIAYISIGNFLKFLLLWTPPAGCLLVGVLCALILPTALAVIAVVVAILMTYKVYDNWEFSDKYTQLEKRIDEIFMSK